MLLSLQVKTCRSHCLEVQSELKRGRTIQERLKTYMKKKVDSGQQVGEACESRAALRCLEGDGECVWEYQGKLSMLKSNLDGWRSWAARALSISPCWHQKKFRSAHGC